MTPSGGEPSIGAYREGVWDNEGYVMEIHKVVDLPGFKTRTDSSCHSCIFALGVVGQKLKALEVMGPNTQRSCAGGSAQEIMASIPKIQSTSLELEISFESGTYLITSRIFQFLAKLTAA